MNRNSEKYNMKSPNERKLVKAFHAVLFALVFSACGTGERKITLITPFTVMPASSDILSRIGSAPVDLSNAVVGGSSSVSEPTELPGGVSSSLYCYQTGIRLNYFDQRPGYPPQFSRVNLITMRDTDTAQWSPPSGPVGLGSALAWIRDGSKTFLGSPLVVNVPKDSGGVIRIQGYFVRPKGSDPTDPKCPNLDGANAALPTFTLWGEVALTPGGPLNLTLPVNVVSSQPANQQPSPYSTPNISGSTIVNPADGLKCRNTADKRTCMNRNLLEIKSKPIFNENVITVSYGSPSADGVIEQKFAVLPGALYSAEIAYIPKNPVFNLIYKLGQGTGSPVTYNIRIDWAQKRYQFNNTPGSPPLSDYPLSACAGFPGKWGLRIPIGPGTVTQAPGTDCSLNSLTVATNPNLVISDLGFGFY